MKEKMKNRNIYDLYLLIEIYKSFFKLGSISFGGGYAMIPLIELEAVEKKKWVNKEEVIDIFAVAESLPGAIGLNSSALVGYNVARVPGLIAAILGNLSPSILIVLTLSILFVKFSSYDIVQAAFNGIRPAIIGLISFAAYKIGKTAIKDFICFIISILAFVGMMLIHMHPILIIALGATTGIVLSYMKNNLSSKVIFVKRNNSSILKTNDVANELKEKS